MSIDSGTSISVPSSVPRFTASSASRACSHDPAWDGPESGRLLDNFRTYRFIHAVSQLVSFRRLL
jgi:hypothetical protein